MEICGNAEGCINLRRKLLRLIWYLLTTCKLKFLEAKECPFCFPCCWQLKMSYAKVGVCLVSLSVWMWAVDTGIYCFFFKEPLFRCISQKQLGDTVNIESSCPFCLQFEFLKAILPQMGKLKAWRREPETHHIPKAPCTYFWCQSIYCLTSWFI